MNLIIKAKEFARKAHEGQKRKYSGVPYIVHPFRVAAHVLSLPEATEAMVCAAYLHDVVEDCNVTNEDILREFGTKVRDYVCGLTSRSKQFNSTENRKMRKLMDHDYLAIQPDEVKTIKLIDRYDNLCDMGSELSPPDFLPLYLRESRELLEVIRTGHKEWGDKLETTIQDLCD